MLWGLIVVLLWVLPAMAQDMTRDAGSQEALRRMEVAQVSEAARPEEPPEPRATRRKPDTKDG